MNELELKRNEAAKKIAELKFIKIEVEYLISQLAELDDRASELLVIQLGQYLDYLKK